jgi:hypothetical protein
MDDEKIVKELLRNQYNTMEAEINKLKEGKFGRVTNVFKMKEIVAGAKKRPQEAHTVLDVETKNLIVSTEEIKRVTLNHVMNTFKRVAPHEDVKLIVIMVSEAHDKRMIEGVEEEMEITEDDFGELVGKLEKKKKKSSDFLLKAGKKFKIVVFKLCRRLIQAEVFPERFFETVLHQLWKKKSPKENLGNHRFIHVKDWLPKCVEALVVMKMKDAILKAGNKYQIGGISKHRVEEHLIVVKAIIERSMSKK